MLTSVDHYVLPNWRVKYFPCQIQEGRWSECVGPWQVSEDLDSKTCKALYCFVFFQSHLTAYSLVTLMPSKPPANNLGIFTPTWFTAASFLSKHDRRKIVAGTNGHQVSRKFSGTQFIHNFSVLLKATYRFDNFLNMFFICIFAFFMIIVFIVQQYSFLIFNFYRRDRFDFMILLPKEGPFFQ